MSRFIIKASGYTERRGEHPFEGSELEEVLRSLHFDAETMPGLAEILGPSPWDDGQIHQVSMGELARTR